ncbi:MAG TPA: amidohydrolase, partial [Clostridia bacterium]|nr:amidohydrolase [Clostridia bacterium]
MNILIKNAGIIFFENGARYKKNVHIGIKDGRIEFVVDSDKYKDDFHADETINGKNRLVLPGLVNTHTHCAMTILRNFANDLPLHEWLFNRIFPAEAKLTEEDVYWGTLLGITEMIKSGTTCFADMYKYMDETAQAVVESGIRANLSISPLKFNVGEKSETVNDKEKCCKFHRDWNGKADGRIKVSIDVHSAYLFSESDLMDASMLAKDLQTGIQIHLLETVRERKEVFEKYGMNSAQLCEKTGIFDVPVLAAHCVHLDENDIDILKCHSVNVSHNITSNLKLGSGIAPVPEMLEKGLNISLGTDGAASNNNLNMFEEMHLASLVHKGINSNPLLINAEQAIKMATENGAKALGFNNTGNIKQGMKADLIILDTDKPHFSPVNDPVAAAVYTAQGSDVDTVIIDGRIVMEGRKLKTIDEEKVMRKVSEIS